MGVRSVESALAAVAASVGLCSISLEQFSFSSSPVLSSFSLSLFLFLFPSLSYLHRVSRVP